MTPEQLKKGNDLAGKIKQNAEQLGRLKNISYAGIVVENIRNSSVNSRVYLTDDQIGTLVEIIESFGVKNLKKLEDEFLNI
jgi:hypothetical protein